MNIFRKCFFKEFFKFFFYILLMFTAISIVAEFFDKATDFFSAQPPAKYIIKYLLLQTPRVILYALPFASLFSILITIGMASKWHETVVIKASGGSIKKMFSSFLVLGALISLIALVLGETVVPDATRKATYVRNVNILKRSPKIMQTKENLWLKGLDGNRILKTSIFKFNPSFGLKQRVEADKAEWDNDVWNLKDVTLFDFRKNTTSNYKSFVSTSLEEPSIFREDMKKPKEMNFMELFTYYSRLEKAGFKNLKYTVRLYEKLAYPTINFVMMLFGLALALNSSWGGGIRAAGLGVIVSVLYWLLYSVSVSLGNTGMVLPWLAPWISPLVFGIAGGILYMRIQE
jgi:lipopolysaccharide export system permease protein